jgi:hypothetical protein
MIHESYTKPPKPSIIESTKRRQKTRRSV